MTPEGAVKKAVEDLLKAERIPYWRMNAGDRYGSTNGRKWRIRGHEPGTADLLAAPNKIRYETHIDEHHSLLTWAQEISQPILLWIETKAPKGKPTAEQLQFADYVRNRGHYWLLVDDVAILQSWLKEHRAR